LIIAIDGPAGSGKSTIARFLAEGLHFTYINSGNLYRAVTLGCLRRHINPTDPEKALEYAKAAVLDYRGDRVFLDGEDVSGELHTDEIDRFSAPLSAIVPIRHVINDHIRRFAGTQNIVVEGRDMTTVVFPQAEHRFFLDATVEARAKRRFGQGVSRLGLEEIQKAIALRDEIDKNKAEGSLLIAPGVEYLDTSDLTIKQVYEKLIEKIQMEGLTMAQMEVDPQGKFEDAGPGDESEGTKTANPGENIQTQLQEEYLKSLEQLEEGQLVEGNVIQVTPDQVFIDVGYKSEGKIPIGEFTEIPKIGDTVSVILIAKENKHGEVIVSKQKADTKIFWKNLRQAFQDHTAVECVIEKMVKGGFDVNLGFGVRAFLPSSQSDAQKVDKPEKMLGQKIKAYVERIYSDGKVNIVVNRRKWLEEEIDRKRNDFF
jgi:small subunit ribosomal protein S1